MSLRFFSMEDPKFEQAPTIIVVELELEGAVAAIADWKIRWPDCMLVGSIKFPVQELWHAAVAAGCDLVANWGALPSQLQKKIEAYQAGEDLNEKAERLKVIQNECEGDGQIGNRSNRLNDLSG